MNMRRAKSSRNMQVLLAMASMLWAGTGVGLAAGDAKTNPAGPEAEIRAAAEQLREAARQGDAERLTEMYTVDAQLILPGKTIVGRDAIRAHMKLAIAAGVRDFRNEEQEFFVGDGVVVEAGLVLFYDASGTRRNADRYMTLWKKVDGRWRIHRDMAVPVAAPAPVQATQPPAASFAVKQVEPYSAIVLPMTGSFSQTSEAIGRIGASLGGPPAGPPFARYFNSPESVSEAELKWEVGFPVPKGTTATAPFEVRDFPAETVAFAVVAGPYEASRPWPQFVQWAIEQGYQIVGPAMEIWMDGPKTEMRIAVRKPDSK
jgi:uncharacterized protein (TIGR02246 family)